MVVSGSLYAQTEISFLSGVIAKTINMVDGIMHIQATENVLIIILTISLFLADAVYHLLSTTIPRSRRPL